MPNSDLKLLVEKVRTERKLAGLTQEQLAERCHVSTKHIANIEKGSMNPSYEILLAIARILPVSLDALITPGMGKTEIELGHGHSIKLQTAEGFPLLLKPLYGIIASEADENKNADCFLAIGIGQ